MGYVDKKKDSEHQLRLHCLSISRIQKPKFKLYTHLHVPEQSSCISLPSQHRFFPRTNQQIKTENRAFLAAIVGTSLTWDIVGIGATEISPSRTPGSKYVQKHGEREKENLPALQNPQHTKTLLLQFTHVRILPRYHPNVCSAYGISAPSPSLACD